MTAAWIDVLLTRLGAGSPAPAAPVVPGLAPARLAVLPPEDWGRLARAAAAETCRWVAAWGEDAGETLLISALFERQGVYLLARTSLPRRMPVLPSHTPYYPAADHPERHMQDLLGVFFTDHPDTRPWTRHQAWEEGEYPLRKDFPAAGHPKADTPPDDGYLFLRASGSGVYEIPVGPVHAGIIEPGHFRFQAVGETVLNLEEHLGYVHKGIEKIAEGRNAEGLARLAARVSGDATVAHTWAACMAMERAGGIELPARALALRAIMAERERVANHLGDIGAICNDVSFSFAFYQFARLREDWQRMSRRAFGHRLMMDRIVPGGVATDLDDETAAAMRLQLAAMRGELHGLFGLLGDYATLEDRLVTTGHLSPEIAAAYGALGYVGRASGATFDTRRDAPYPPYDRLRIDVPVYQYGDVAARLKVRAQETLVAFGLIEELLADMPSGPTRAAWTPPGTGTEGLGIVEGWRGETLAYVRFGDLGTVARYYPRDPSWFSWPVLEKLMRDNIVPDFPVCNKSVNGSYSGHDL